MQKKTKKIKRRKDKTHPPCKFVIKKRDEKITSTKKRKRHKI
jgi:hypothetical protein